MNTQDKSSSENNRFLSLRRLNTRFPWLKLAAVCFCGAVALLDLLDITISKLTDLDDSFPKAPMQKHVKATERTLKNKKLVALTFDDGPSPDTTPILLDTLAEKNTLATFFMLGTMARQNPEIVRRATREGHEIASHTMYHQNLITLSPEQIAADVNEAISVFESITGNSPTLARVPYGNYNDVVRAVTHAPIILWSVDTLDWRHKNTESIMGYINSQIHDGAIILMHDIHPTSVEAIPIIIDTLKNQGYEFVTVSELASERHVKLSPEMVYYHFRP